MQILSQNSIPFHQIGCGTSLCGLVTAKLGSAVILSDRFTDVSRQLLIQNVCDNKCHVVESISPGKTHQSEPAIQIVPLTWGEIGSEVRSLPQLDFVLASDCFYAEKDFEDIIATIAYLLEEKGHENSSFITAYQLRNSEWNLNCLMRRYGLEGNEIPLNTFEADSEQLLGSKLPGNHSISLFRIRIKR
jgi:hypothetical protein